MSKEEEAPSMNDIIICNVCEGKGKYYARLPDEEGHYECFKCHGKGYTTKKHPNNKQ